MHSSSPKKIAILGSGNWGSAIARIIGFNVKIYPELFLPTVNMWTFEETLPNGELLTKTINSTHENPKYLKGVALPENVVAVPSVAQSVKGADLLVFVLPHQFLSRLISTMKPHISPSAHSISLIKGIHADKSGFCLLSDIIQKGTNTPCSVLMGANVANDVARDQFCEATIGATSPEIASIWKKLFHRKSFQIRTTLDVPSVEMAGALKNIVAVAAGFTAGLGYGENTRATIMRLGLSEIQSMIRMCFPDDDRISADTLFESCGVADLITTCYAGRNARVSKKFAENKGNTSFEDLEKSMLNGQKLQGTLTAIDAFNLISSQKWQPHFPVFCTVYSVVSGELSVVQFVDRLMNMSYSSTSSSSSSVVPLL